MISDASLRTCRTPLSTRMHSDAHILFLSDLRCVVGGRPAYGLASVVDEDVKLAEPRGDQRTERLDTSHVAQIQPDHMQPATRGLLCVSASEGRLMLALKLECKL